MAGRGQEGVLEGYIIHLGQAREVLEGVRDVEWLRMDLNSVHVYKQVKDMAMG